MATLPRNSTRSITLVVAALVVVAMVILLVFPKAQVNGPGNTTDINIHEKTLEIGEVINRDRISTSSGELKIANPWSIDVLLLSDANSNYECLEKECTIYVLQNRNSNALLKKAVVSVPVAVHLTSTSLEDDTTSSQRFSVLGEAVDFSASHYFNVGTDSEGNLDFSTAEAGLPLEYFGCTSKNICIHAGPFSNNEQENAQYVQEFRQLLSSLSL